MLLHYPVRATASIPNSLGMHLCIETTRPQHPIVRVSPCTLHMALAIFRSLFVDREVGVSDDEIFCTVPRISARKRVCVNTLVVDNTLYRYTYASPSRETHSGRTCTIAIVFGTALVTHCGHASAPVYQATSSDWISSQACCRFCYCLFRTAFSDHATAFTFGRFPRSCRGGKGKEKEKQRKHARL